MSQNAHTPTPLYYYSADGYIRSTEAPLPGRDQSWALCKPSTAGSPSENIERRDFLLQACNSHAALVDFARKVASGEYRQDSQRALARAALKLAGQEI